MEKNFLVVDPTEGLPVLKGLASAVRVQIVRILHEKGPLNINDIAQLLDLPQSTVSINVQVLEDVKLIRTETLKARKGSQKICYPVVDEVLVVFKTGARAETDETIEVSMPLGLYTSCHVGGPCGLCSVDGIIGLLDVPSTFLDPDRMKAGLIWFTRGYVEYQFPNNAKLRNHTIRAIEISLELSSEVPGTNENWPSDITLSLNGIEVGTWTSPGDFGDKRGVYTPSWWKLTGSQYGKLKQWRVDHEGTFLDDVRLSDITLADLNLSEHHSIRLRLAVKGDAKHPGGVNIYGRGFGNYDQDIVLRLHK